MHVHVVGVVYSSVGKPLGVLQSKQPMSLSALRGIFEVKMLDAGTRRAAQPGLFDGLAEALTRYESAAEPLAQSGGRPSAATPRPYDRHRDGRDRSWRDIALRLAKSGSDPRRVSSVVQALGMSAAGELVRDFGSDRVARALRAAATRPHLRRPGAWVLKALHGRWCVDELRVEKHA